MELAVDPILYSIYINLSGFYGKRTYQVNKDEGRKNIICMDPAMLLNADVKSDLVHNTHHIYSI